MPFKSKAQMRLFFAKEKRGELPEGTAREWARETKSIKKLPEHVKKACFVGGFLKTAFDGNLPEQAAAAARFDMTSEMPGQEARRNATTGQAKGRATRTQNVQNEDKEFKMKYHRNYDSARGGKIYGY